jgi:hypothetical protein
MEMDGRKEDKLKERERKIMVDEVQFKLKCPLTDRWLDGWMMIMMTTTIVQSILHSDQKVLCTYSERTLTSLQSSHGH